VYAVRVLDADLAGSEATLVAGLDWIAANAAAVSPPIRVAVTLAGRPGLAADAPVLAAALAALDRAGVLRAREVGEEAGGAAERRGEEGASGGAHDQPAPVTGEPRAAAAEDGAEAAARRRGP